MRLRDRTLVALIVAGVAVGSLATASHRASSADVPRTAAVATSQSRRVPAEAPSLVAVAPKRREAVDSLLAVLDDPGADDSAINKRMVDGYFELLKLLREDPSVAGYLESRLVDADREDPAARMMVGALSGSGVPEAQEAMIHLLDQRRDDDEFMSLLVPAMGFAVKPTDEIEARLVREMDGDHARTRGLSTLALGVMADRVSPTDPGRAGRIVAGYDRRMAATDDPAAIRMDLTALGNAGTSEAAAVAARYLDDDRPGVRARAVEAMRHVDTPAAESSMLRALRADPDENVRESALRALSEREATSAALDAYGDILASSTSEPLALGIVEQLGDARDHHRQRARALLARAAAESSSKRVRD